MSSYKIVFYFVTLIVNLNLSEVLSQTKPTTIKSEIKKTLNKDCATSYSTTCLKLDIVSWVDKLNEDDNFNIVPGVSVVKENNNNSESVNTGDLVSELAREFPNDPNSRLDAFLMKKVTSYLSSHSVKFDLWNNNNNNTDDVGEARRRRRPMGGGGGGMLLAGGAMMKATLMALAIGGIAAMAGKAMMTGLISLMLSAIIGIKSLSQGGQKHTTYEIVSKPVYSHSNTHSASHEEHGGGGGYGHSSYGRSFDVPLPLGLQPDYKPAQ